MATDDLLKEILTGLKRLERMSEEPTRSSSQHEQHLPRPTEQFPKVELAIERAIAGHAKECAVIMKERREERIAPLMEKIIVLERQLLDMRKELGGKINGVREDAAKTATGSVSSVAEKAETALRILKGAENEVGLEEMVRDLGQWIESEEDSRRTTAEKNKFNIATILTIVGILVAIGLGVANILL
jgi:hypothetical protein